MITEEGVAWFFMSEGSLNLMVRRDSKHGIGFRIWPELRISNTDPDLIKVTCQWMEQHGIKFALLSKIIPSRKKIQIVQLTCLAVKNFLDQTFPFLLGKKKKVAKLIYQYYNEVWLPYGYQNKYRPSLKRFLQAVQIKERISQILGSHIRKYDLSYFLNKFGLKSLDEAQGFVKRHPPFIVKKCEICGKEFTVPKCRSKARFCSKDCWRQWRFKMHYFNRAQIKKWIYQGLSAEEVARKLDCTNVTIYNYLRKEGLPKPSDVKRANL